MSKVISEFPNKRLLDRTAARIFDSPVDLERFREAFFAGVPTEEQQTAVILLGGEPEVGSEAFDSPCARVVSSKERESLREQHDRGEFYFFDPSSLFCTSAIHATSGLTAEAILDLCSSPGGKGIYTWQYFKHPVLIANEVSQSRLAPLISNLKRCRISPSAVSTRPAEFFSSVAPGCFGLVLIDAPCSGQSLLLKGTKNPGCFHPVTIGRNASRQKQILIRAGECVAPGGYLAYMTCTFSPEENEEVLAWFRMRAPEFTPVFVPHLASYQSALTREFCYRLFPWQGGAGGFTVLLQKHSVGEPRPLPSLQYCWQSESLPPS